MGQKEVFPILSIKYSINQSKHLIFRLDSMNRFDYVIIIIIDEIDIYSIEIDWGRLLPLWLRFGHKNLWYYILILIQD